MRDTEDVHRKLVLGIDGIATARRADERDVSMIRPSSQLIR